MKKNMFRDPDSGSGLLKAAFFSGITLLVLFGAGLGVLHNALGTATARQEIGFHRLLQEYDFRLGQALGAGRLAVAYHQLDSLSRDLDHMETRAEGVENWLSVLNRRRRLAAYAGAVPGAGPRYLEMYRRSALRALYAFPFSEPIAAVAAAALVQDTAITRETEEELRRILPRLTGAALAPVRLSLHVLLGDFHGPERAAENILGDGGLSLDFAISAMGREAESVLSSLVVLGILEGETGEALSAIQTNLAGGRASHDFIRFAAEFFYDFGNPVRSAELFHMLPGRDALIRQADALWLAGYTEHARHIWALLASPEFPPAATVQGWQEDADLEDRALYNLAVTAQTREEAEELFRLLVGRPGDTYRELGLIRLSRMLDAPHAMAVLQAERGNPGGVYGDLSIGALVDLEILRRRMETGEFARVVAETWMLLQRYPDTEGLHQWAAWYFGLQRNFTESAMLLRTAERQGFSGQWKAAHEALQLIRYGHLDAAINAMATAQAQSADWVLAANLGRIFEARNASARALEYYQTALALLMESESPGRNRYETASQLQFRIARCLRTIGRIEDSRHALLLALELNPNNLSARLELSRM